MNDQDKNQQEFLQDRSIRPKGKPNAQGRQQGLKIQVEERNNKCNAVEMSYMVRKDTYINIALAAVEYQCFVDMVEDAIAGRLERPRSIHEMRKGVEHARITVSLDQDGVITATLVGQGNSVEVKWMPTASYPITEDGQPISPAEQSRRNARGWVRNQHRVIDRLERKYKPFNPNGEGGDGSYGNQFKQQYKPPQQPQSHYQPPASQPATSTANDFF